MDAAKRNIRDLSWLEPENFKFRNTEFLMNDQLHYDIEDHQMLLDVRKEL